MPKGPHLNHISRNFTTRDSLGVEGVVFSMSADICPVVSTVTPRAFYWPFLVWNYYDFYRSTDSADWNFSNRDYFIKKQDYFFVMAVLLTTGSDQNNLVGKTQSSIDISNNQAGPYPYNPNYFKTSYGGMQYYDAGIRSLGFMIDRDPETDQPYKNPKLTKAGEKLALAFEDVIKDTTYYKEYRLSSTPVPRHVLEEYGQVINIGLKGFDECKNILKQALFHTKSIDKLAQCASYILHLNQNYQIRDINRAICRQILYDHLLPDGSTVELTEELQTTAAEWEIVVGRQYFAAGLEMIWKYMLDQLGRPFTLKEWINYALQSSDFDWDLSTPLSEIISSCHVTYEERERMVGDAAKGRNPDRAINDAVIVILSVYNRFNGREDFGEAAALLGYGINNHSISLIEFIEKVNQYKEKSLQELLIYILTHWLIFQHYHTAFEKLFQGRDGFYYEIIDDRYIRKQFFGFGFQEIRLVELMSVMKDLDMIQETDR